MIAKTRKFKMAQLKDIQNQRKKLKDLQCLIKIQPHL